MISTRHWSLFLIWSSSAFVVADVSAVDWKNGIVQIWECREKAKFKSVSLVQLFPITTRILLYYWRVVDFKKWRHYFVGRNNEGRVKGVKRKLEFLLHIFTDELLRHRSEKARRLCDVIMVLRLLLAVAFFSCTLAQNDGWVFPK